jgi:predicted nucleic acid-binding protein
MCIIPPHWPGSTASATKQLFFCRLTQPGFLRLANTYDTTLSDSRVAFAAEPAGLEITWRRLTRGRPFTPKLWNGAYLAAFAEAEAFEVVTFDRAFTQYKGVACNVLS